jgi:fucose 4-O-acetylase-like acetyltransferase
VEDLTDIKNIWLTAKVDELPSARETIRFIKRYRFKQVVKKTALVSMMLLMTGLMLRAAIYGSDEVTARIGEVCIFIAYFVLITSNANSLKRAFYEINRTNREFVEYLKQAQKGRIYFYEKIQPLTFLIMCLGLYLWVFESVRQDSGLMLTVYSAMTIVLVILWFVARPLFYKKSIGKLKETIDRLEAVQNEL